MTKTELDNLLGQIRETVLIHKNIAHVGIFLLMEINNNSENLPPELAEKIRRHLDAVLATKEFGYINDIINKRNKK